jgi:hypothetical protein
MAKGQQLKSSWQLLLEQLAQGTKRVRRGVAKNQSSPGAGSTFSAFSIKALKLIEIGRAHGASVDNQRGFTLEAFKTNRALGFKFELIAGQHAQNNDMPATLTLRSQSLPKSVVGLEKVGDYNQQAARTSAAQNTGSRR